jgi:hypothetical protein
MKLPRLTSTAFCALASLLSAFPGWAQDGSKLQRTAMGILNDAHKNEGKEVVLDCAYVRPEDGSRIPRLAQAQGLAVFYAIDEEHGRIPVLIPLGAENALIKQFGSKKEYLPGYGTRTRKLRGIVAPWAEKELSRYRHYLRYGGAKEWTNSGGAPQSKEEEEEEEGEPQKEKAAFDDRVFSSFSYDGKRLVEARVVDVGPEGVVVTSKDSTSVIVPLDRAIKMPDLRMKAKDAMEAALAGKSAAP